MPSDRLDDVRVAAGAASLAQRDPDLARLLEAHGPPPTWDKGPGFQTLVDIVLGQQVSLGSARAALERLRQAAGDLTPELVVQAGVERLAAAGLTRQKAASVVGLAEASSTGRLDLAAIGELDDAAAIDALVAHRGVGRWTADIYLLMGLGRPDVWPSADLALVVAARSVKDLDAGASAAHVATVAEEWRPLRSVAARMLWQAYLLERGRPLD